jgi:hypothetical protein
MGKTLLLSLLTAFSFGVASAQTTQPEKRFQVGLIAGKTIQGSYQHKVPWGNAGGGFAGFDLSYAFAKEDPNFTLHFQPNWENFRYRSLGEPVVNGNGSHEINFNSINTPVLIRLAMPAGKWISPFMEVGASYKIRTKNHYQARSVFCGFVNCREFNFEGNLMPEGKRNDANLLVGIGAEFHWGSITIPVSIRLNEGLGTYSLHGETESGRGFSLTDLKTRTLQVVTGISF